MGNEMGNNNSSGLQEEETATTQVQERCLQETGHVLVDASSEIQPNSSSKDSNLEENPSRISDHQLENETSVDQEEEGTNNSTFDKLHSSHHPEHQDCVDLKIEQPELAKVHDLPSVQASNESPQRVEVLEDFLGSNVTCTAEESGHSMDTNISKYMGESVVSDSSLEEEMERDDLNVKETALEEVSCEDRMETEDGDNKIGNGLGKNKYNGELPTEMNLIRSDSPKADANMSQSDEPEYEHNKKRTKDYTSSDSESNRNCVVDVHKGVADPHIVSQISDEREEETEVLAPAESEEVEVKSNDKAGCESSEIKPSSPSKDSERHEKPQDPSMEENLLRISDHQLEYQTSTEKEEDEMENSTFDTLSSSHDPEPQDFVGLKFDQPELANIHVDPSAQDNGGSPDRIEDILVSNLTCSSEQNGHPIGTNVSKDMNEIVVSDLEVEMKRGDLRVTEMASEEVSNQERMESEDGDEIGNDLSKTIMTTSGVPVGEVIKSGGELPNEMNPICSDSPKAEAEAISVDKSLNSHLEVSEFIDNCLDFSAPDMLIGKEPEHGEIKQDGYLTQSCIESVKETLIDNANVSQSELMLVEFECENNEKRTTDYTPGDSGINKDCIVEAEVAENRHLVDTHINNKNEVSTQHCNCSQNDAVIVPESVVSTELPLMDCKREDVSHGIGNDTEVQAAAFLLEPPVLLVQTQDNLHNTEMESEKILSSKEPISEFNQESYGEFFVTKASTFDSANLIEKPGQDLSQHTAKTTITESKCPNEDISISASDDHKAVLENMGRFSTESNSSSSISQTQMQKSPSFGFDLRIEARTEESDRIPLLYQDKTTDASLGNPTSHTQYGQDHMLQYQAIPMEEKVVMMEKSDSEKSKTPFLGFLKEEEDAHIITTPQKHENNTSAKKKNKETTSSTLRENKEKRKPRSSIFTNCMCCTTVIN